jgi:hypothetical protein
MSRLTTITRILGYPSLELATGLPRGECARRLREASHRWQSSSVWFVYGIPFAGTLSATPGKPVTGRVEDRAMWLCRSNAGYNPFQTYLFAELNDDAGGTRLRCWIGVHPFVLMFSFVWLAMLVWFGMGFLTDPEKLSVNLFGLWVYRGIWPGILSFSFLLAFVVGWAVIGRYAARKDGAFLVDFICAAAAAHRAV